MSMGNGMLRQVALPRHCGCERDRCCGEVVDFETAAAREVYIRCDPASMCSDESSPECQAEHYYGCLSWILERAGMTLSDVVHERVFFRDIGQDFEAFDRARRGAYRLDGVVGEQLPIASFVQQPPCHPGQSFELQVYAVAPGSAGDNLITVVPSTATLPAAKVVRIGGIRHFYAGGVTGIGQDGQLLPAFRQQCDTMFQHISELMQQQGATFSDVLRTWCYLSEMERDYDEFNQSRNAFFQQQNISRLPASTGIRAQLHPSSALCSTDCYAVLDTDAATIEVMHTPTLNEAPAYGSAFARGMKLVLPEKTVLYISGTASVDEDGETAHVGDVRRQIERMLLNVRELLAPCGASFADFVQVITYLKSPDDLSLFQEIAENEALAGIPNSIVCADVCRPDLLCEMEAIAVLPVRSG